jgi:putative hydrolase of the HAD superfamily
MIAVGSHRSPRLWIFDLDNTLHNASPHIFPHINRAMTEYIERHLALDNAAATRLRQGYWDRYGATLQGLVRHHAVDPHHFLRETHQFADLQRMLIVERGLFATLKRLSGRKVIFSNAPAHYTRAVLAGTGIAQLFDAVYTIESVRFQPKPGIAGFLRVLHAERQKAEHAVMVEDSLPNLRAAKQLGMGTIWLSRSTRQPAYVDRRITSLRALV